MSTTIFGKAAIFFSVSNDECTAAHWAEIGILLRQKKMQRSLLERQTERKNRCPRLPRHTGNPQLKYGKASATTAWETKSTRTPSLVSQYEKTGDLRFAPNLLPYTGVRAVFFGVTCAVVRKVYGPTVWKSPIVGIEPATFRSESAALTTAPRDPTQWIPYLMFFFLFEKIKSPACPILFKFSGELCYGLIYSPLYEWAQKIMGFLSTRLSLPLFFGRFRWKIENKKFT